MAITLAELVYSELIGLVQRTRVSYPACFNKIRLTENMVDKRESYTKEDLLASGRGELFGAKGPAIASTEHADDGPCGQNDRNGW